MGRDTYDLRAAASRLDSLMPRDAAPELWFDPDAVRQCQSWALESGGRLGFLVYAPGAPAPRFGRYRYQLAWIVDPDGQARVHSVAVVRTIDAEQPRIAGCQPSNHDRLRRRSAGLSVLPGVGYTRGNALGDVESGLRARDMQPRIHGAAAGNPAPGQSSTPLLVNAWVRWHGIWLEGFAPLGTIRSATSGFDSTESTLAGIRHYQKFTAGIVSIQWRDVRVGAGPAFVREAWNIGIDRVYLDSASGQPVHDGRIAVAGNVRNRLGLLTQAAILTPVSARTYIELRAYLVSLAPTLTPNAFGLPPMRVSSSRAGLGVTAGLAF